MAKTPEYVADLAGVIGLKVWPEFIERACCNKKEIYLNGGWRAGKSSSAAFLVFIEIISRWLQTPLPLDPRGKPVGAHLIWLVGPDYEQARQEYFYLSQWFSRVGHPPEASAAMQGSLHMTIAVPGLPGIVEVVTKSASDPTSLGSVPPVVILACEAGQISEESKGWLDTGRAVERNPMIIWSGTFENDEGKQQFSWYEQESEQAYQNPTRRKQAFRLPTWENAFLFANCIDGDNGIEADPTLEDFCPDSNHGEAHSGLNHPMIRQIKEKWKTRPRDFDKRFGGIPQGVNNRIYEWATERPEFYLRPLPPELRTATFGRNPLWIHTKGGIDPGLIHPAALVVGSQVASGPYQGQTWVRRCIEDTKNTAKTMWEAKDFLQRRYGVTSWGGDPNGLQYSREYENINAMQGSLYKREARVKVVNGVAGDEMLFFDSEDPGVVALFSQLQRVHRRKDGSGQLVYDRRTDDDMVAAFEDMMAEMHGQLQVNLPQKTTLRRGYGRRSEPVAAHRRIL